MPRVTDWAGASVLRARERGGFAGEGFLIAMSVASKGS
jgi:hypothetical protein